MVNLVKEAQESKKKIIMSAMVSVLVIVASVPLFVVAGMFEMQVWTRVLLMGIGFVNNGNGNRYCMCIRQRSRSL